MTASTNTTTWRDSLARSRDALRADTGRYLILPAAIIALWRRTQLWFGYPTSQGDNADVEPLKMQLILYSLLPFILITTAAMPDMLFNMVRRLRLPMILMFALIGIATILSVNVYGSVRGLMALITLSLPLLYFLWHFGVAKTFKLLQIFTAVVLIVNWAYAILLPHFGFMTGSLGGAMRGMFMHKNPFGCYCAVTFMLLWPYRFDLRRPEILARSVLCLIAIAGVVASRSSTAASIFAIGSALMIVWTILSRMEDRGLRGLIMLSMLFLSLALLFFFGVLMAGVVAQQFGKDVTFSGRVELWEQLWPAVMQRPWFGHGVATFRQSDYFSSFIHLNWGARSTHNTYLEIALSTGLPSVILWIFILLGTLWRGGMLLSPRQENFDALRRAITIIPMIMFVAITEAAQMFQPQSMWALLVIMMMTVSMERDRIAALQRPGQRIYPPVGTPIAPASASSVVRAFGATRGVD